MPSKHPPLPGTLASFAESGLPVYIVCNHCGRFTRPDYNKLVHQVGGWGAMVAQFAHRMRCTRCRQRGARFTFERPRSSPKPMDSARLSVGAKSISSRR